MNNKIQCSIHGEQTVHVTHPRLGLGMCEKCFADMPPPQITVSSSIDYGAMQQSVFIKNEVKKMISLLNRNIDTLTMLLKQKNSDEKSAKVLTFMRSKLRKMKRVVEGEK